MNTRRLFVISDLHLGTPFPADGPRRSLEKFLEYLAQQKPPVELVINGDFIDFLGEPSQRVSCLLDESTALHRLQQVLAEEQVVFDRLRQLIEAKHKVTLLLGSGDLELSFPKVRRHLYEALGGDDRLPVEFLYDNEAYQVADVIIEHGSRYDAFNVVNHDQLRAVRSILSRGEQIDTVKFKPPPGFALLRRFVAPLLERYPFLSYVGPVSPHLLPLLIVLDPNLAPHLTRLFRSGAIDSTIAQPPDTPQLRGFIGASTRPRGSLPRSEEDVDDHRSSGDDYGQKSGIASELLNLWRSTWVTQGLDAERMPEHILAAVRSLTEGPQKTADATLRRVAEQLFGKNFRCVIFGHSQRAQDYAVHRCRYLNTGSWSGTVAWPERLFTAEKKEALRQMREFFDLLMAQRAPLVGGLHYVDLLVSKASGVQNVELRLCSHS